MIPEIRREFWWLPPRERKDEPMYWTVDRVEGPLAVCRNDTGQKRELRLDQLPRGTKEGDVVKEVRGAYRVDLAETTRRRQAIEDEVKGLWG